MIRYRCPRCNKSLAAQDNEARTKKNCPHCEQRVQIPAPPPPNKTMLGTPEPPNKTMLGALEGGAIPVATPAYPPPAVPCTIIVEAEEVKTDLRADQRPDRLAEVEDRRGRPKKRRRDEDDDRRRGRRRPNSPCPRCGCTDYPRQQTRFGGASIALLVVGIIFWPLLIVAFLAQEKWDVCPDCGEKLRQTGTGF